MSKKNWWTSKTIWAGLVTIAAGFFGLSEVDQAGLTDSLVALVTAVSGALAVYGRLSAKTEIGKKDPDVIE